MDRFRPEPDVAVRMASSRTWWSSPRQRVRLGSLRIRERHDLLMYAGATRTKFGQYSIDEKHLLPRALFHSTESLKEVNWDIPIPVLDQEDLLAQSIDTSTLVPGAPTVDALGSCTANASTAHIAQLSVTAGKDLESLEIGFGGKIWRMSPNSPAANEQWAIVFYHLDTDQTQDQSQEWPPADCGSTGSYCCEFAVASGLVKDYNVPHNVQGALLALQTGTVIQGAPWFKSWMQPDSDGFVDGDGSVDALQAAIESGVAGGHETCERGIVQLAQAKATGAIDLQKTIIKVRNSWSPSFGLDGDYLIHASTLGLLGNYVDYKQMIV